MRPSTLALAVAFLPLAARADELVAEGQPAPTFSLRTLNPEAAGAGAIALDRYVGAEAEDAGAKVVLLSFFASWCEPCRRELPFLVQLDRMYREQGLRVLSVDLDRDEEAIGAARRMCAEAKVAYPVLSDRFNLLARRYLGEQAQLPSVFLVRRDGTIARVERGYARDAAQFLLAAVQGALGAAPRGKAPAAAP